MTRPGFCYDSRLKDRLAQNLAKLEVSTLDDPALRRAAVSLAVVPCQQNPNHVGEGSVLLTLRTDHLKRHGGQYALPGGRVDSNETPEQAALRELTEELGVSLQSSDIIGRLDDYPTRSGFAITPFVIWAGAGVSVSADPEEVAEVHYITLAELDSPDIPILTPTDHGKHPVLSAHLVTVGHEVYAPTAAILFQFREVAWRGRQTRVAHFDQPGFAWK